MTTAFGPFLLGDRVRVGGRGSPIAGREGTVIFVTPAFYDGTPRYTVEFTREDGTHFNYALRGERLSPVLQEGDES